MRPIIFRGKRHYDGEWVYGYPLMVDTEKYKSVNIVTLHEAYPDTLAKVTTSVDFNTLGQFTGLTDADGKDIYEGDLLLSDENAEVFEVVYDAPRFCFNDNDFGFRFLNHPEFFHVVGNIHDNPQLLKGGEQ